MYLVRFLERVITLIHLFELLVPLLSNGKFSSRDSFQVCVFLVINLSQLVLYCSDASVVEGIPEKCAEARDVNSRFQISNPSRFVERQCSSEYSCYD